ncbi:Lrp/AsnC family transcriptional regulator [Parasphingopyxis sp.]|uniref:Lrp/AsnC family transcriptional regulator n=1 Tax=Parasphingopyxis sp. TaxID=1920299 RepID=UPI00263135BC|nr:Lrp/AsnC family transcriptional regulator [Parasphingopyxis sp.]
MKQVKDDIDRRILAAVQEDARLTAAQLGEQVGLSPTAALKRLKKLRADGTIKRDVALVSADALGQSVQMIVAVSLARESSQIVDRFKRAIREEPRILDGFFVTGEMDFLLLITAKNMADYEEFTRDFFYNQHGIETVKTSVILSEVKRLGPIPIDL